MSPRHRASRVTWARVSNLLTLALIGAWWITLGPTAIGGPASYVAVDGHSMDGTYATGDLIVLHEQDTYRTGQIIAFRAEGGQVIHRIIGGNGTEGYTTKGDNNPEPDPWHPKDSDVLGTSQLRLAGSAHYLALPSQPWFAGLTAGVLTLLFIVPSGIREELARRRATTTDAPAPAVLVGSMPRQSRPGAHAGTVPAMRSDDHDTSIEEHR